MALEELAGRGGGRGRGRGRGAGAGAGCDRGCSCLGTSLPDGGARLGGESVEWLAARGVWGFVHVQRLVLRCGPLRWGSWS
eukprot:COSAG02_NODE_1946_length_10302_cov_13.656768_6_plen_81_part_00